MMTCTQAFWWKRRGQGAALHWEPSGLCENDAVGIMTTRMRRQLRVEAAAVGEPLHKTAEREISKKKTNNKIRPSASNK